MKNTEEFSGKSSGELASRQKKDRKSNRTWQKNKRQDSKVESNDSPEIPDKVETSDIPSLPLGGRGVATSATGTKMAPSATSKQGDSNINPPPFVPGEDGEALKWHYQH